MKVNWETSKLISIEAKNPIEFWNVVKRMQKWGESDSQSEDIIHNEWLNHFSKPYWLTDYAYWLQKWNRNSRKRAFLFRTRFQNVN